LHLGSLQHFVSFTRRVFRNEGEAGAVDENADIANVFSVSAVNVSHDNCQFFVDFAHGESHFALIFVIHQKWVVRIFSLLESSFDASVSHHQLFAERRAVVAVPWVTMTGIPDIARITMAWVTIARMTDVAGVTMTRVAVYRGIVARLVAVTGSIVTGFLGRFGWLGAMMLGHCGGGNKQSNCEQGY
jgi:hypothetical protein